MTRDELINDVVRAYFEGRDWQGYLRRLARDIKSGKLKIKDKRVET